MKALTIEEVIETKESLEKALAKMLGQGNPIPVHFEKGKRDYLTVTSDPLDRPGIFGLMFANLSINSFGGIHIMSQEFIDVQIAENEDIIFASFILHVIYLHQDGGSNGCELGFLGKRLIAELKYEDRFSVCDKNRLMEWVIKTI